jgi:uncharacterized protein
VDRVSRALRWFIAAMLVACVSFTSSAAEGDFQAVPKLERRVTDLTGSISAADEARIEQRIRALEQSKGAQIAVLMLPTTQPEAIFDYAMRVAEAWKIGRKGVDDGIVFVIAKDDRKMQILTGPGIQGVVTDAMSKRVIAEFVAPRFREGRFADGVYNGVDKLAALVEGEALPPPPTKKRASKSVDHEDFVMLAVFAALFVAPMLRALVGRFVGAIATGGVTGLAAWFIIGGLIFPIVLAVIVTVVALFAGLMNFRRGGGWHGGGWSSGGGGWSSGGSDSFSGGGGGFDGGGASGDW